MTDAYNAGRAAGIREAAAVVQQMQDRKQVVWPKDILSLLDSAPARDDLIKFLKKEIN